MLGSFSHFSSPHLCCVSVPGADFSHSKIILVILSFKALNFSLGYQEPAKVLLICHSKGPWFLRIRQSQLPDSPGVYSEPPLSPHSSFFSFFITCAKCYWLDNKHVVFGKLPKGLPTERAEVEEKVVILGDSVGRRWPVLYHEINGLKALVY